MSLRSQAQRVEQGRSLQGVSRQPQESQTIPHTTITASTFNEPRPYGIVDNELVEVLAIVPDWPGMSPAYFCRSDEDGSSAPVSFLDIQVYSTLALARQALQQQGRLGQGRNEAPRMS